MESSAGYLLGTLVLPSSEYCTKRRLPRTTAQAPSLSGKTIHFTAVTGVPTPVKQRAPHFPAPPSREPPPEADHNNNTGALHSSSSQVVPHQHKTHHILDAISTVAEDQLAPSHITQPTSELDRIA